MTKPRRRFDRRSLSGRRVLAVTGAALVSLLVAVGCSSDDSDSSATSSPVAPSTSEAPATTVADSADSAGPVATAPPDAVVEVSTPPGGTDAVGARDDVTDLEC